MAVISGIPTERPTWSIYPSTLRAVERCVCGIACTSIEPDGSWYCGSCGSDVRQCYDYGKLPLSVITKVLHDVDHWGNPKRPNVDSEGFRFSLSSANEAWELARFLASSLLEARQLGINLASELRRLKPAEDPFVCVKCGGVHITMQAPIEGPSTVECHDCGFEGNYEVVQP